MAAMLTNKLTRSFLNHLLRLDEFVILKTLTAIMAKNKKPLKCKPTTTG